MIDQMCNDIEFVQKHEFWTLITDYWHFGLIAFFVSLLATPIVRWVAYHFKIVDRPDDMLKPHAKPIAYLGGIGIAAGLLVGMVCFIIYESHINGNWKDFVTNIESFNLKALAENPIWRAITIVSACMVITIVGLLDDLLDIKPLTKVLGQCIAAAILMLSGIGTKLYLTLFGFFNIPFPASVQIIFSILICLVLVISACNATNLLDGLDGLCGGVTAIIALGFLCLATWLATWGRYPGTDELRMVFCLVMAGALIGFLPYNVPPASIFMGDAGSMLLGFFVATMIALFCHEGPLNWALGACVVFALPILDTALAVVRRLRAGKNIFAGDRSHLYDQLVDRGMTVKQVVVLFYVLALVAAVLGNTLAISLRLRYSLVIVVMLLLAIWTLFAICGLVTPEEHKKKLSDNTDKKE